MQDNPLAKVISPLRASSDKGLEQRRKAYFAKQSMEVGAKLRTELRKARFLPQAKMAPERKLPVADEEAPDRIHRRRGKGRSTHRDRRRNTGLDFLFLQEKLCRFTKNAAASRPIIFHIWHILSQFCRMYSLRRGNSFYCGVSGILT